MTNKEERKLQSKKWYTKQGIEYHRAYREKNREKRRKWNRDWIKNNNQRYNASKFIYREKVKIEVFKHYCVDGEIKCVNCGFTNIDALCLDHINNDGAEQRKILKIARRGGAGMNSYEAFKKFGYPEGLQILCANCNLIKEMKRKKDKRLLNPFYLKRTEGGGVGVGV